MDDDVMADELREARRDADYWESRADQLQDEVDKLKERIAEMSTKINAVYSDMSDLYRMAD
jgi:uncharacterized coiled-coil DUF342 family protein